MTGAGNMGRSFEQWQMGAKDLQRRMILAPTPREREGWYAMLMLAQGWTTAATAEALERDPHTIGRWAAAFGEGGPRALIFEQTGGPPALELAQQEELKGAVQQLPSASGLELAAWTLRQAQEEGGTSVHIGVVRQPHQPQQLPELPAPAGVCLQAAQEEAGQGR